MVINKCYNITCCNHNDVNTIQTLIAKLELIKCHLAQNLGKIGTYLRVGAAYQSLRDCGSSYFTEWVNSRFAYDSSTAYLTKRGNNNSCFATVTLHMPPPPSILRRQWSEAHRPLGPHSGLQVGK